MAYFPEYYGGEYWNRALTSMGDNIAKAMEFYRQRHEEAQKTDATFQELSKMVDPTTRKPYIPKEAYERITAQIGQKKEFAEQGYLQARGIGEQISKSHEDLLRSMPRPAFVTRDGVTYRTGARGELIPLPQTAEQKEEARRRVGERAIADPNAITTVGRMSTQEDVSKGKAAQAGVFVEDKKGDLTHIISQGKSYTYPTKQYQEIKTRRSSAVGMSVTARAKQIQAQYRQDLQGAKSDEERDQIRKKALEELRRLGFK